MKKALITFVVFAALTAMVVAGLSGKRRAGAGVDAHTEPAQRRDITQVVKATGRIDPREKVDLSAHVVAKIERLFVEEGDEVTAGQAVVELEREAFQAVWERASAQRVIGQNQVRQAEIDLRDAVLKSDRYGSLAAEGVVSAEQTEAANLGRESAELRLAQAREQLRQADADLEKSRDDLDKVTLYAPISGRIIALNAEQGEVVVSGLMNNPASVIATIADLSEILVEVDVDETEIVSVREGQAAEVSVDAVVGHTYHGLVEEIGSSGYTRAGKGDVIFYSVKVLLEDADARLRPGMTARAEIAVETHVDTVVVPIQVVVYRRVPSDDASSGSDDSRSTGGEDEEEQVVFVVAQGKAERRPVETGLADTTHIEILTGIDSGTEIVTGPYRILRDLEDGDAIKIESRSGEDEDSGARAPSQEAKKASEDEAA